MRLGIIMVIVVLLGGFIFWRDIRGLVKGSENSKSEAGSIQDKGRSGTVKILQKWDMPSALKEVSGIAYLDKERFACIQDEKGIIYIYNITSGNVEKEIPFSSRGDYEDIALVGQSAWVVRSDGMLFEVDLTGKSTAKQYGTPLTVKHNIEGLAYDKTNNRLLLAIKDDEPNGAGYKGIYGFDLAAKSLATEPVYKIDLEHTVFNSGKGKKNKAIRPSAIGIHPATGDLYITDGPRSRLLIMNSTGTIRELLNLGKAFGQPEGLAFSPQGDLFIANEGNKQPGNILAVTLQ